MLINHHLIKRKKNIKKIFICVLKYSFYFFWIISIFFLLDKSIKEFNQFSIKIKVELKNFLYIFIFFILITNISSYRLFYFLKKLTKYSSNYTNWSILFFQTALMNCFLEGFGHLFRGIQLKKKNVSYSQFVSINYVIFILIFFINFLLFLFFYYFLSGKKIILLYSVFFIMLMYILINKKFYDFFLLLIEKKLKFKKKYKNVLINLILYCKFFFQSKKNILIFLFFVLVIFFLEAINFILIISNFILIENFSSLLIIFIILFYLNKVPYLANFIGLNELILGLVAESLGFQFLEGSLIQFIYRMFLYISIIFSNILYYFINFKK
jgi:hypothetical protein